MVRDHWIPAAQLVSAAIIGGCFLIAFIVINSQAGGWSRPLGLGDPDCRFPC